MYVFTVVHLYHLNDGKRWLFTASHDKVCKFWDLQNNIFPISSYKKIAVSDGVWLSHWISIVMSFEETGVMGKLCFIFRVTFTLRKSLNVRTVVNANK